MQPAFSVIFLTTLIGVGQGMFLGEPGHLPFDPSSLAHLGGAVRR